MKLAVSRRHGRYMGTSRAIWVRSLLSSRFGDDLWMRISMRAQASGPDQSKPICLLERPERSHLKPKASALSAVDLP
jgi:hypothetical protein